MLHLIPLCDYYFPFSLPHPSLQIPNTTLYLSDPITIYYSFCIPHGLEQAIGPISVLIYDNMAGRASAPEGLNRGFQKAFFIGESQVSMMDDGPLSIPFMGPVGTRTSSFWLGMAMIMGLHRDAIIYEKVRKVYTLDTMITIGNTAVLSTFWKCWISVGHESIPTPCLGEVFYPLKSLDSSNQCYRTESNWEYQFFCTSSLSVRSKAISDIPKPCFEHLANGRYL